MTTPELRGRLSLRDEASPELRRFDNSLRETGANLRRNALVLGGVATAIGGVGLAAAGLVRTYQDQQRAERVLAQVVSNTGTAYASVESQILSLTAALQRKTNFGDEAQIQALTRMTVILGDVEKAQAALPAVLDAASASGRDLNTVSETLTKALAGQANTAESLGLKFDEAAGFAERLQAVQDAVGGSAEANADPFVQLGNAMGDFQETLGELLAGPLTEAVQGLTAIVGATQTLINTLAASNVMWDENGKRIRPVLEELDASQAVWNQTAEGIVEVTDATGDWVQFLTEEEDQIRRVNETLNNYNVEATQVAAINRENFEVQQRLVAIEKERAETLAELAEEQAKVAAEAEAEEIAALAKQLEEEAEARRKQNQMIIESTLRFRRLERERQAALRQAQQETELLAQETRILSADLVDNTDTIERIEEIMRLAANGTIDWAEAQQRLRAVANDTTAEIDAQADRARQAAAAFRQMEASIRATAEAQAQFAGRGPSMLPVTAGFVREAGTSLFQSFGARRQEAILSEQGIDPIEGITRLQQFLDFFLNVVQGFLPTSLDRGEALLRAITQIEGFNNGGVVGGPRGSAQLAVVHGGETILPTHQSGTMAAGVVVNNDFAGATIVGIDDLDSLIQESVQAAAQGQSSRRSRR